MTAVAADSTLTRSQLATMDRDDLARVLYGKRRALGGYVRADARTTAERLGQRRHADRILRRYKLLWREEQERATGVRPTEPVDIAAVDPALVASRRVRKRNRDRNGRVQRISLSLPADPTPLKRGPNFLDQRKAAEGMAFVQDLERTAAATEAFKQRLAQPRRLLQVPAEHYKTVAMEVALSMSGIRRVERRNVIAFDEPLDERGQDQLQAMLERLARDFGVLHRAERRYAPEPFSGGRCEPTATASFRPYTEARHTLDHVLQHIGADRARGRATGRGVTIGIIDTGINGHHPEFPTDRQAGGLTVEASDDPWVDDVGHGTMVACIAAACRSKGGRFEGVAPGAKLASFKTEYEESHLAAIMDTIRDRMAAGERFVVNGSFGIDTGEAPLDGDFDDIFEEALADAVDEGLVAVFSAGNYHEDAVGDRYACARPTRQPECSPTSIWLWKCRQDVMTVGASNMADDIWYYSSRGPGQRVGVPPYNGVKPDVVAPTPAMGGILYASQPYALVEGWGTSGAAPQVAGLLALLMEARPDLSREELFDIVRKSARDLTGCSNCQGAGVVDCAAALQRA